MARKSYRDKQLQTIHGDLNNLIPDMVNKYGQVHTAQSLGVSQFFVSDWLKKNGYVRITKYERVTA